MPSPTATPRRRPRPGLAISIAALILALAGTATAAGVIVRSSSQIKNGAVKGPDVDNGSLSAADLSDQAESRWARVNQNGVIQQQSGGITVTRATGGVYELDFGSDVSSKGMIGTLSVNESFADTTVQPGSCARGDVACESDTANHVQVLTWDLSANTLAPSGFYLSVLP